MLIANPIYDTVGRPSCGKTYHIKNELEALRKQLEALKNKDSL